MTSKFLLAAATAALLAWFVFRENFDRRIALGMGLALVLSAAGGNRELVHVDHVKATYRIGELRGSPTHVREVDAEGVRGANALVFYQTTGPIRVTGNRIWGNRAPSYDYGWDGGAFEIYGASGVRMTGNTLYDNTGPAVAIAASLRARSSVMRDPMWLVTPTAPGTLARSATSPRNCRPVSA